MEGMGEDHHNLCSLQEKNEGKIKKKKHRKNVDFSNLQHEATGMGDARDLGIFHGYDIPGSYLWNGAGGG